MTTTTTWTDRRTTAPTGHPLLSPHDLAGLALPNRVVMAPMTRMRADHRGVPTPLMIEYYRQRAGAALIVSEGISPNIAGRHHPLQPGLDTEEQVAAWRSVTGAVHTAGGRIFAQLMHSGRNTHPANRPDGGIPVAPSAVVAPGPVHTLDGKVDPVVPRALTTEEVRRTVADHAEAARAAIRAGFDGVEIHGANGYLVHQFLADGTNLRADRYGGPVSGRIRFAVEVVEAVADAIGAHRVGLRISPGNKEGGMVERDPAPTYRALLAAIAPLGPAYLHLTDDPRYPALDDLRPRWSGTLVGNTGEHVETTQESATALVASGRADLVSVGRPYIFNPDVVERIAAGVAWAPIRGKDYHYGSGPHGYVDLPRHDAGTTLRTPAPISEKLEE
ncbi:alkene reductase [Nocardiopsis lambiniae]|uniref:Alkene reductase n=1 Tax=Nocardiopsis lambiniae TaxID=3075539 RepID=A0ABU2MB04_9ACTN|nr:alkene reductase [Nocardiopsis sp. DSM 44743]MDT0329770.1 alkene reductase [Nocardiopsis sp. DSM 44743]